MQLVLVGPSGAQRRSRALQLYPVLLRPVRWVVPVYSLVVNNYCIVQSHPCLQTPPSISMSGEVAVCTVRDQYVKKLSQFEPGLQC